jgi:hypothetical protein
MPSLAWTEALQQTGGAFSPACKQPHAAEYQQPVGQPIAGPAESFLDVAIPRQLRKERIESGLEQLDRITHVHLSSYHHR